MPISEIKELRAKNDYLLYIDIMKKLILGVLLIIFSIIAIKISWAESLIAFGPHETNIMGSIAYSVIGEYKAQFSRFHGRVLWDDQLKQVNSVYLEIEVNSIHSNCPWCDKIARSRRLLSAVRYPKIIFKSIRVFQDRDGYKVEGILQMHGIKRKLIFPFKEGIMRDQNSKKQWLDLQGSWQINRKAFHIIWNRYLDHGGILVGDQFKVNWGIKVNLSDSLAY